MNVLLTNDDGIDGRGLRVLAKVMARRHRVFVAAPRVNNSGASCRFGVYTPIPLRRAKLEGAGSAYALDGSPVDCVITAMSGVYLKEKADVVVSGINDGSNIGTDILYSGTCGAARQASLLGLPGIALSVEMEVTDAAPEQKDLYYKALAEFALKNLDTFISLCGESRALDEKRKYYPFFVNINAPPIENYKGVCFTKPCARRYNDVVDIIDGDAGKAVYVRGGDGRRIVSYAAADTGRQRDNAVDYSTDYEACSKGFVSVGIIASEPLNGSADAPAMDDKLFIL